MQRFYSLRTVLLLVCMLFWGSLSALAQIVPYYTFSSTSGSYQTLTAPTVLSSGISIDDQSFPVPLPFTFVYDNTSYNSVYVTENGYLSLGSTAPAVDYTPIASINGGNSFICAFARNLAGLDATTELSYQSSGFSPNRVFTVQWKNFGYPGSTSMSMSFQIQLFETTNKISLVYGTSSINGTVSGQVGLRGGSNIYYNSRSSSNGWNNTVAGTASSTVILAAQYRPASGLTFTFSPPICSVPAAQPTNLSLNATPGSISGSFTAAGSNTGYLVVRTPNVPLNATPADKVIYIAGSTLGNGTVVYAGPLTSFSNSGLPSNTYFTYTVFAYDNSNCQGGPVYNVVNPLTGTATTTGPRAYTLVPTTGISSFTDPASWQPQRIYTNPDDTLYLNNGGILVLNNVPAQTVKKMQFSNNTYVIFNSAGTAAFSVKDTLEIQPGSVLALQGNNALTLSYATSAAVGNIKGTLEVSGNCTYDASAAMTRVTGTVNVYESGNLANTCTCAPANMLFLPSAAYNHLRNGGSIPSAYYASSSTVTISGITATAPGITSGQDIGNLVWNCPNQTGTIILSNNLSSVGGDFTVQNTGGQILQLGGPSSTGILPVGGNFTQTAGIVQQASSKKLQVNGNCVLSTGNFDFTSGNSFILKGNMIQEAGHQFTRTGSSTSNTISFEGSVRQNVTINSAVFSGIPVNISLNNPEGAVLTGIIPINNAATHTILNGSWSGPGGFSYNSTASTLVFRTPAAHTISSQEWPAANGPQSITVNMTGAYPDNKLMLSASRIIPSNFTLTTGIVVLGNYDLTYARVSGLSISTPGADKMIATNGIGRFISTIGIGNNISYLFPVGDITDSVEYTPVWLSFTNSAVREIGVRVTNMAHPADAGNAGYLKRYWTISGTGTGNYSYRGTFTYSPADVVGTGLLSFQTWDGAAWQPVPSVNQVPVFTIQNSINSADLTLEGKDMTGRLTASRVYTWNGSVDNNYNTPGNWTPVRTVHDPVDMLVFDNGQDNIITNVITETITRFTMANNTSVHLRANASVALTINSDEQNGTDELAIPRGCSLYLDGTAGALNIGFGNSVNNSGATIGGLLEVSNVGIQNGISFANCVGTVATSGVLTVGGNQNHPGISAGPSTLYMNGTYYNKNTTVGNPIPNPTWNDGSAAIITGLTNAPNGPYFSTSGASLYNVIFDCPAQTSNTDMAGRMPAQVRGTLEFRSTGTGSLMLATNNSNYYTITTNKLKQTGGVVNLNASNLNLNYMHLYVQDSFLQDGGSFITTQTGTTTPVIHFSGTGGRQYVRVNATNTTSRISYHVQNQAGIYLYGSNGTADFNINNGGTLQVSTSIPEPVISDMAIRYGSKAILQYDAAGNYAAHATVWPAISSPRTVIVDIGSTNVLRMPFDRVIDSLLRLNSGDLDISSYNLTLGSSVLSLGNFYNYYSYNRIRLTSGSLTRWYGTGSLPTSPVTTGIGYFPIANGVSARDISVYFSAANALSNGGTITLRHNNAGGLTTGLSVADGSYTITRRTNTSWSFTTGNGFTATGMIGIKASDSDMLYSLAPIQLRLMKENSVVGSHVNSMQRYGLSQTDLTDGPFYIGAADAAISAVYVSVTNGSWKDGSTWDIGSVPVPGAKVIINSNDTVTADSTSFAGVLNINSQGMLIQRDSVLTVDSIIINNGIYQATGGILNLGPAGGGRSRLMNNGLLDVQSGILNINGTLTISSASTFGQSGGTINVDGNGGTNRIGPGKGFVEILTVNGSSPARCNVTGGTLRIVDPNPNSYIQGSGGYAFYSEVNDSFGVNHQLIFGDGQSTASTSLGFICGQTYGNLRLGTVIVQGNSNGSSSGRALWMEGITYILGDLTINNPGGAVTVNSILCLNGNLTNNGGSFNMNGSSSLYLGFGTGGVGSYNPQLVSGNGSFSSFRGIVVNNMSAEGVTFAIGNFTLDGNLGLSRGKMRLSNGVLTQISGTASSTNGSRVIGTYKKRFLSGTAVSFTYPIGDEDYYTPVAISGPSNTVSTTGYISASTTGTDHPAIASGPVQPNRSVNRYYTLTTSPELNLTPYTVTITPNWNNAEMDPGTVYSNFVAARFNNGSWSAPLPTAIPDATSMRIAGLGNELSGAYQIGEANPAPAILSQPVAQQICHGMSTSFSVSASNVYTNYQWQVRSGAAWGNITNGAPYSGVTAAILSVTAAGMPLNGTYYRCRVSSPTDTVYSQDVLLTVNPVVTPAIAVSVTPDTVICAGTSVTFSATSANGGSAPVYQWQKNGSNTGTNNGIYTSATLADNDVITCILTSNAGCLSTASATSSPVTMKVNPVLVPSVTVTADPGNAVCPNTSVNFTATPVNGGSAPVYQWYKNSSAVGSNSPNYTDNTLTNGNTILCRITSNATCRSTSSPVASNTITMSVTNPVTPQISISASPSGAACAGANVYFTASATNAGSLAVYQWQKNGVNVGTNSGSYTDNTLINGDVITCTLTSSLGCVTTPTATSNSITRTVTPSVTPSVTISANPGTEVCAGTPITFNSSVSNPGSSVFYTWYVNGAYAGSISQMTLSNPVQGDRVSLLISTSPVCATVTSATSDTLQLNVNQPLTPVVTITAAPGLSVCSGTPVTFTAVPVTGGSNPSYQWKKNGGNVGSNSPVYTDNALAPGSVVTCVMMSNATCITAPQAISNALNMEIHPSQAPTINIIASPANAICAGATVTFTAHTANADTVTYQWKKNNADVGTGGSSYSAAGWTNGDVVYCVLTSNGSCNGHHVLNSNNQVISVAAPVTPSVTITADPGTAISSGQTVTFTANVVNGGTSPIYQWKKNSVNVGTNSSTYVTQTLQNNDIVWVNVTSNAPCPDPAMVESNQLHISITNAVKDAANAFNNVVLYPNPNQGALTVKGALKGGNTRALTLTLRTLLGQEVYVQSIPVVNEAFDQMITLPAGISNGIYLLQLSDQVTTLTHRITISR